MQVVFSPDHERHSPENFIAAGRIAPAPECPERAHRLHAAVAKAGYEIMPPRDHGMDAVRAVHDGGYLEFLEHGLEEWRQRPDAAPAMVPNAHPIRHMRGRPETIVGKAGYYVSDMGCPIGAGTWQAALSSAQVALTAAELVLDGAASAYALCRPPGHHAYSDLAGGFCFLNNVAIAAQHMRGAAEKVAILDVDVHHGNGTQGIFYDRADVLFCSLHGDPSVFYPYFAGYAEETGDGAGEGYTLNIPLPPDTGDHNYLQSLDAALARITAFSPDYLLISLGLDAQENDPLGILSITTNGFAGMGRAIGALGIPSLIVQEGGYLCDELADNLLAFLSGFETGGA